MSELDTRDIDAVAGALYFVVGRATEGGPNSYRLSVAGISGASDPAWGKAENVRADSGYSIGTIQVDLGKRGTWALGSTSGAALKPGEQTYVDAIIGEAAKFADAHDLDFETDKASLRAKLLTHGNGEKGRSSLEFLETGTYNTFNKWSSSEHGKQWIHRNIDYPQVRHVTQQAMDLLDKYGKNITEEHRLEAIAMLAKTANQMPAKLKAFESVMKDGGDYDDLLAEARKIEHRYGYYAGVKAANAAADYEAARKDPETAASLDRAQAKVASADFDPSTESTDPDLQNALKAIGQATPVHILRQGSRGDQVAEVQADLASLGFTDKHGVVLTVDGKFGSDTQAAVRAFQEAHRLTVDGRVGPTTLRVLHQAASQQVSSLHEAGHPGHEMYCQALDGVHAIDALYGRAPDTFSANLAGSLTAAAHGRGLARIDHVILGEGATRAFAVEGDPRSPFRQFAAVDVMQAGATPLAQSSAEFLAASRPDDVQQAQSAQLQPSPAQAPLETMHR